ncbi:MAG: hypothetical protein E6R03_04445 [Hyphomicrobiaceae bacterium]|nr:MAG: hypothetical protein E6R03_04445 [Hyphomicrobiaceae bacterium]
MSSHSKIANHNNIVLLRAEPQEEGHKGHPRGVILVQVDTERKQVSVSASLMSHTEPKQFDRDEGVVYAKQRGLAIVASTAGFLRCEDPDEKVRKAHRAAALEKADRMAWLAILAAGATPETLELIDLPNPQAVLTAIIYALQGRGGVDVDGAVASVEVKRAAQAEKEVEAAQAEALSAMQKLSNQLRQVMADSGYGAQLAAVESFAAKAFESAQPGA